jgi:hypothetical protein
MRMQINVRKVNIVAVLLLSLVHVGCASARSVKSQCESVGYEFFYDIARAQREFVNFPLEKKYDVLICASQGTHPPRLEFASLFAAEGARGAELLQEHLRENTDDLTVRDIAYALLRMQELGTYDVIADKRLVGLLELRVNGMKNESWRDIALGNLKRLRER